VDAGGKEIPPDQALQRKAKDAAPEAGSEMKKAQ